MMQPVLDALGPIHISLAQLAQVDASGTPAHLGECALRECAHKMTLPDSADGSRVVAGPVQATDESATMAILFPILQSLLPDQLRLGDSQACKWLPQGLTSDNQKDLKPDGFVICKAFLESYQTPSGNTQQRPALGTKLFSCLRCLVEGKHKNAQGPAATGQAQLYAKKLVKHMRCLHVLLIDKSNSRAESWQQGLLVGYVDGDLSSLGSKEFLAKFLLGAGEDKDAMLLPTAPRVDDLEVAQAAILLLPTYNVVPEQPVLGVGGTGIALHMTDADNKHVAVKVVRSGRAARFLNEIEMYSKLVDVAQTSNLVTFYGDGSGISFLVVSPVGHALQLRAEEGLIVSGILALCAMHRSGFAHGDARLTNLINVKGRVVLIDFSHSHKLSTEMKTATSSRCDDIARFLASITGVMGCSNLDTHWKSLVPAPLAVEISSFVDGDLSWDKAQKLGRLALKG